MTRDVDALAVDRGILTPSRNPAARQWLLCLPHAGAGAMTYLPLARRLPISVGLRVVQPPGREMRRREPSHRDVDELIAEVLPAITAIADRPIALYGHSLGAITAFELARAMRSAGLPVCHLYVSGRPSPDVPLHTSGVAAATDDQLVALLRALGGTPPEILDEPKLLSLILPALRADLVMNETYRFRSGPALDVPLTVFVASDDPRAPAPEMARWARHTTRAFRAVAVSGGHFAVLERPEVLIDVIGSDALEWE